MQHRTWITTLLLAGAVLAACGGGAAATQQPAGTQPGGGGDGGSATQQPQDTQAPEATEDAGGGGGGGAGASAQDIEALGNKLAAPHSTEISKTTADNAWFVIYESTDSVDSLKSYYEKAIADAGQHIFSTTTIQGGVSYVFSADQNATGVLSGAVNIYPSGDGKTAVQVTVGNN